MFGIRCLPPQPPPGHLTMGSGLGRLQGFGGASCRDQVTAASCGHRALGRGAMCVCVCGCAPGGGGVRRADGERERVEHAGGGGGQGECQFALRSRHAALESNATQMHGSVPSTASCAQASSAATGKAPHNRPLQARIGRCHTSLDRDASSKYAESCPAHEITCPQENRQARL